MKIGIALAAYRPNPKIFSEQLQSIQQQNYRDWVCIITLDSPLGEIQTHPDLRPFFEDSRFTWVENSTRLGHKKNFEKAIQKALTFGVEVIGCSDQDDIWYKDKLSICLGELTTKNRLSLVHSDMHILRENRIQPQTAWVTENRGTSNSKPMHFIIRNMVAGCSMLFDAELARLYPEIPEGVVYHDHWYPIVAAYHGGVYPISKPLYAYRQHSGNEVGITPFQTIFSVPKESKIVDLFWKCRSNWQKSYRLAQAIDKAGLPLSQVDKLLFLRSWDLGLGLFILGLLNIFKDPALARASFSRAFGKLTLLLYGRSSL